MVGISSTNGHSGRTSETSRVYFKMHPWKKKKMYSLYSSHFKVCDSRLLFKKLPQHLNKKKNESSASCQQLLKYLKSGQWDSGNNLIHVMETISELLILSFAFSHKTSQAH